MIPLYMNGRNVPLSHLLGGAVFLEGMFLHGALHNYNYNNNIKCANTLYSF